MNNFFLLNEAIDLEVYEEFKLGMAELVAIEREDGDKFWKHKTIYELSKVLELFENYGQDEQAIVKFIEQSNQSESYFSTDEELDTQFVGTCNGFLGIDFNATTITEQRQIINNECFHKYKKAVYCRFQIYGNKHQLISILKYLYPNYTFDARAIDDVIYWNNIDIDLYERLHELLVDIEANPFTGGLGKTEVLKNKSGVASKRLDGEHRVTYSLKNGRTTVLACKGHYE